LRTDYTPRVKYGNVATPQRASATVGRARRARGSISMPAVQIG
jgi:hypothetical protein